MSLNLPPYNIKICNSSRREPGLMVFNVRYGSGAPPKNNLGWIIAIDQDGKIVFDIFYDEFVDYKDQNLSYLNQNKILKICQNFTSKIRIDLTVSPYEAIVTLYK